MKLCFLVGCCDIQKISNIDIEKKNTDNIDIFDIFTRAKARVINSLRCFFFAQDLVSHATN